MKKFLFGFTLLSLISLAQTSLAAKNQIGCDLRLLNANGELDSTADEALKKNYLIINEKSKDEIKQYDTFTNYTDGTSGCFVHGTVGWKMVYNKQGHVELTVVNPRAYEELCFADSRESQIAGRPFYKVSTHLEMNNPPERFVLNLPTPEGINLKSSNIKTGENVRFIHLQCELIK